MKICFILPSVGTTPAGGFKAVYEYANKLSSKGHLCTIVHPNQFTDTKKSTIRKKLIFLLRSLGFGGGYKPNSWFSINPKVNLVLVKSLHQSYIPESDVIIATAWETALAVNKYPISKGRKYYLVMHYEYFMSASPDIREKIKQSFTLNFTYISISPSASEMLLFCGINNSHLIPVGINFEEFYLVNAIDNTSRNSIGFAARTEQFKGLSDTIEALSIVRNKYRNSDLQFWCYGKKNSENIPNWITFYEHPSSKEICDLYNRTLVFVSASHFEGWGLPGAEAMTCGCALASTDSGGVKGYATHNETALISPIKQPEALAENVIMLLENPTLRLQIAKQGNKAISAFTWEKSVDKFEKVLRNHTAT